MDQNEVLFDRAQKSIPGGVNSPVRAFRSVGGAPRFIKKALGPHMYDVEGKPVHRLHRVLGSYDSRSQQSPRH